MSVWRTRTSPNFHADYDPRNRMRPSPTFPSDLTVFDNYYSGSAFYVMEYMYSSLPPYSHFIVNEKAITLTINYPVLTNFREKNRNVVFSFLSSHSNESFERPAQRMLFGKLQPLSYEGIQYRHVPFCLLVFLLYFRTLFEPTRVSQVFRVFHRTGILGRKPSTTSDSLFRCFLPFLGFQIPHGTKFQLEISGFIVA